MPTRPLHISYNEHLDWLEATPFGAVMDRQGHGRWRGVSGQFGFFPDEPGGAEIGFKVVEFSDFGARPTAEARRPYGLSCTVDAAPLSTSPRCNVATW
jgi:hypothetical protein